MGYSHLRMKMFSRMPNSVLMTATLLAVIIGSLCFSVGEGLRLTPFPNPIFSSTQDAGDRDSTGTIREVTVAKYGPLDVPAQTQKRAKRQTLDLAADSLTSTRTFFKTAVRSFTLEAHTAHTLSFIAPNSGRAPPFQS